ncbi:arginase family protein [Brachybacterium sacelli]|uniref:Arginase n=1 Tax=Brachybacterium sacelli TaxID=173364 RepID=A0ABS4X7B8_9MICO|nr:arginase family protein [Brachybacterium sacelli]MBP2384367.1 arginase [Brachybacterium sacelli]
MRLICSPFHLGRENVGMGQGPRQFVDHGAVTVLEELGLQVEVRWVQRPERSAKLDHGTGNAFAVQVALAAEVADAIETGQSPVVLGGNCSTILGAVGGMPASTGLVFFDAHADANTPETTTSGFLDGMPVAVATGRCWQNLAGQIPGFAPLPDGRVLLVGQRSIDPDEQRLLDESQIGVVTATQLDDEVLLAGALDRLGAEVEGVHLHVDLDVIDSSDGLANEQWAEEPGPSLSQLTAAIGQVGQRVPVRSVSLTSYNPDVDTDGRALRSGLTIFGALGALVAGRRSGTSNR